MNSNVFLLSLVVESVHRKREPMPQMEAIYLLTPTERSVNCLIEDFKEYSMYKCAHVFFIEGIRIQ